MDIYNIWFDLKPGESDLELCRHIESYMSELEGRGELAGWRISRRKLGLGPKSLPEFHVQIEFENLAQLDAAFTDVSGRTDPVESLHFAVNSKVVNVQFALYRDFPDPHRRQGEEKF